MTGKNIPPMQVRKENIHFCKNTEGLIFECEGKTSSFILYGLAKHLENENLSLIV
jgi:hypothetical protein